ncbi:MAG: pilus assembly protein PilM [Steroidobacteraceae bacterium]|jgi:MSHA biogenesis protein MshI
MATTSRARDGRYRLESCFAVKAPLAEQRAVISSWLAAERSELGAVGTVLDAADYQLLLVESPDVLAAELKAAVRWRLKDMIDFPLDEAVVDVFGIPEPVRRTGAKMMYAVAAKRQAVEDHVATIKAVTQRFDVIDIPELALRNLAAQMPEAAEGMILLWLNAQSAQLLVIKQSTLYLARTVQFTSQRGSNTVSGVPDVDAIALELQRSTDYFESHYEQSPIGHLVIAPHNEHADMLAAALRDQTSMRIQTIDLNRVLTVAPGADAASRSTLLAIGAALRDDHLKL